MKILVPHFGRDLQRLRPLAERWAKAYAATGCAAPVYLMTDNDGLHVTADTVMGFRGLWGVPNTHVACPEASGFADLVRPGQPFDLKGALVCAQLLADDGPFLVLDLDAFPARDPVPFLQPFWTVPIAMPLDAGALMHDRTPLLDAPYQAVRKVCAGVQWFGSCPGRSRLVAGYRRAWQELEALPRRPWTPPLPHLLEQYAWSLAMNRRGGRVLPHAFNWAPHFLGESPDAVVNHWFGRRKWDEFTPASA